MIQKLKDEAEEVTRQQMPRGDPLNVAIGGMEYGMVWILQYEGERFHRYAIQHHVQDRSKHTEQTTLHLGHGQNLLQDCS